MKETFSINCILKTKDGLECEFSESPNFPVAKILSRACQNKLSPEGVKSPFKREYVLKEIEIRKILHYEEK